MKKVLFLLMMFCVQGIFAQRVLNVEPQEDSSPSVFPGLDNEAKVVIRCDSSIHLTFDSNVDKEVVVEQTKIEGANIAYHMVFNTGKKYRGRKIQVYAPHRTSLAIPVELEPKQCLFFLLTDPDNFLSCYQEHRKKATDYFVRSLYNDARNEYIISKQCSDADTLEANQQIVLIDSIEHIRQKGDEYMTRLSYNLAASYYKMILGINSSDSYALRKLKEAEDTQNSNCTRDFAQAENLFYEKAYTEAEALYKKVVERGCEFAISANERLIQIRNALVFNKNSKLLAYEYQKDVPIGVSYGSYKDKRVGGYVSLRLNEDIFEMLRQEKDQETHPEVNFSFGWTKKIVKPIWIFWGVGYTGICNYEVKEAKEGETEPKPDENGKYESDDLKIKFYSAVSPEIGLVIKCGPIGIRYTFQYRFSTDKKHLDDTTQHVMGIGIAF